MVCPKLIFQLRDSFIEFRKLNTVVHRFEIAVVVFVGNLDPALILDDGIDLDFGQLVDVKGCFLTVPYLRATFFLSCLLWVLVAASSFLVFLAGLPSALSISSTLGWFSSDLFYEFLTSCSTLL